MKINNISISLFHQIIAYLILKWKKHKQRRPDTIVNNKINSNSSKTTNVFRLTDVTILSHVCCINDTINYVIENLHGSSLPVNVERKILSVYAPYIWYIRS